MKSILRRNSVVAAVSAVKLDFSVQADHGDNGDAALVSLRNLKPSARVSSNEWSQVNSLFALNGASENAWYKDGNAIHLKMVCRGNNKDLSARSVANIAF